MSLSDCTLACIVAVRVRECEGEQDDARTREWRRSDFGALSRSESSQLRVCMLYRALQSLVTAPRPLSRPLSRYLTAACSRSRSSSGPTSRMASRLPHVEPYSQGNARIRNVEPMKEGKWVELRKVDWTDEDGKDRVWEMAARKTTSKGGIDAVAIAAVLKQPNGHPPRIPIILQYRPPIQNICVELPAGLIDEGESPEQSGIRELYEETGYGGEDFEGRIKVLEVGSTIVSDPGASSLSSGSFLASRFKTA